MIVVWIAGAKVRGIFESVNLSIVVAVIDSLQAAIPALP